MKLAIALLLCIFLASNSFAQALVSKPALQHGVALNNQNIDLKYYFVSEKLDGVRGYWDGRQLKTRQGNLINPPNWFTAHWPNIPLDGELWQGRAQFDQTSGCIRRQTPTPCWRKIKFHIFDLPENTTKFANRVSVMERLCAETLSLTLTCIPQYKLPTYQALQNELKRIVSIKGEGLMLHHQNAIYQAKRVNHLLKVKPEYFDTALVVGHITGKGKFSGMLGSLLVVNSEGIQFKLGSGLNKEHRMTPPPIGSTIHYKYLGKTTKGVPRFASFVSLVE